MSSISKNNPNRGTTNQPDRVLVKWCKKARMWARTEFSGGKQTISWTAEKPNG